MDESGQNTETAGLDLDEYLRATGESDKAFGGRVGAGQQHINRIRRKLRRPRPDLARRIIAASGNRITWTRLYGTADGGAA